jgi:RNA polymerase sigma-70 factor (ECF subfamily)
MRPKSAVAPSRSLVSISTDPQTPAGEIALAAALACNLESGFEALACAWQNRLYAFELRITGSHTDAEELTQETLVRAWRALSAFEPERRRTLRIRPWLFQIAVNLARNNARGARRSGVLSLDALDDPERLDSDGRGEAAATRIADEDPAVEPEASLERRQRLETLAALLLTIPHAHRLALTLRHIEGMSYPDIAVTVGLPIGTVKSHVSRGAAELRRALDRDRTREAYREETESVR